MNDYIPDLTERFPEGFGGVDMTDSFYPLERGRAYYQDLYEDDGMEIPYEIENELQKEFEVGMHYRDVEFDGGLTHYRIARISKNRDKVFVTEEWANVDGCGKRKPRWHKVIKDDAGYEKFQIDPSYDSWLSIKQFNL